jgi:serine/threonine-protein kinase
MITCAVCGTANQPAAKFCKRCGNRLAGGAPAPTGMMPASTRLAGRYQILRRIGQGGMAAVYQAQDLNLLGRNVAIKEMSDASLTDPAERQQAVLAFQQEAQLLVSLDHPHIVRVSDFFPAGNKYYLVMDFVDGASLEDLLMQRGHGFGEPEVLPWLYQLCDALRYLHSRTPPIIFRDLKPGNIMVERSGAIKLVDFGIARRFRLGQRTDTMQLGTPGYAPPEQHGQGQTDARADIYALGVTAHRLLTGYDPTQTPFQLPPVRRLNPQISPVISDLIEQCVQNDVNARPPRVDTVQQVVTGQLSRGALPAASQAGPAVQAGKRPTTRLVQAAAQLSTQQIAIGVGAALVAVVLGILLFGPWLQTNLPVLWYELPAFLMAGPMAYAAARRMGAAFVVQSLTTFVVWATIWLRFAAWPGQAMFTGFLLGLLLSALVYEISFYLLYQQASWRTQPDIWQREVVWYGVTGIVAAIGFYAPWYGQNLSNSFWIWPGVFALGAAGWFLGDLVREGVLQRMRGARTP